MGFAGNAWARGCGRASRRPVFRLKAPRPPDPPERKPRVPGSGATNSCSRSAKAAAAWCYMAEQEEPVRRRVALKVIKLGMDTKTVIARFEAERQALALMDHPNIAKVLDAGATAHGPALFRHGTGPRHQDHRLLRPKPAHHRAAAGAVHPGLPGHPARAPKGHHPPRPQALEHPGDPARRRAGAQGD